MTSQDIESLASEGDAILVIEDEDEQQQLKLRVLTSSLRNASKVFNALFGPQFAEGKCLDKNNPPEISIVDDPASLKIICQVLHFQNKKLPHSMSATAVKRLAEATDKYDVAEPMFFAMASWLDPKSSTDPEDLRLLLEAAMIVRNGAAFEHLSRNLIFYCATPFFSIDDRQVDTRTLKMCHLFELKRTQVRTTLSSRLHVLTLEIATSSSSSDSCLWSAKYACNVLLAIQKKGLLPSDIARISLAEAFAKIRGIIDASRPDPGVERICATKGTCTHKSHITTSKFEKMIQGIISQTKTFKGVELDEVI